MPQALACIAAYLVTRLADHGELELIGGSREEIHGDVLTKAIYDIQTIQSKRNGTY